MTKRRSRQSLAPTPIEMVARQNGRRRRTLILPRRLAEGAEDKTLQGKPQDRAYEIIQYWADLEQKGDLDKKETSLDDDFLLKIFGEALGHKTATQSPENYQLQRNFTVEGIGTADGALGIFSRTSSSPIAVIELKDANTDLDHDRTKGRTPVQQSWDYLNALPGCPWGVGWGMNDAMHRPIPLVPPVVYRGGEIREVAIGGGLRVSFPPAFD